MALQWYIAIVYAYSCHIVVTEWFHSGYIVVTQWLRSAGYIVLQSCQVCMHFPCAGQGAVDRLMDTKVACIHDSRHDSGSSHGNSTQDGRQALCDTATEGDRKTWGLGWTAIVGTLPLSDPRCWNTTLC